jgi:hypothetical protein
MRHITLRTQLFTLFLLLTGIISVSGAAIAAPDDQAIVPLISSASTSTASQGTIVVSGAHFTPGGDVFIAIHGRRGEIVQESRWTTASVAPMTINGVADPVVEAYPGGILFEIFDHLGDQPVTVRAFDRQTATWSNPLEINAAGTLAVHGPGNAALAFMPTMIRH